MQSDYLCCSQPQLLKVFAIFVNPPSLWSTGFPSVTWEPGVKTKKSSEDQAGVGRLQQAAARSASTGKFLVYANRKKGGKKSVTPDFFFFNAHGT